MTIMERLLRASDWAMRHNQDVSLSIGYVLLFIVFLRVVLGRSWHRPFIALCVIPIGLQAAFSLACAIMTYFTGHGAQAGMFATLAVGQVLIAWMFVRLAKAI